MTARVTAAIRPCHGGPADNMEFNLRGFYSVLDDFDTNQSSPGPDSRPRGRRRPQRERLRVQFNGPNAVFFDATDANVRAGWRGYRNIATLREWEWTSKGGSLDFNWQLSDTRNLYFAIGSNTGSGDKLTYPVVDFRDAIGFSVDLRDDPRFPQTIINGGGTDDSVMDLWTVSVNDQFDEVEKAFRPVDFNNDVSLGAHHHGAGPVCATTRTPPIIPRFDTVTTAAAQQAIPSLILHG